MSKLNLTQRELRELVHYDENTGVFTAVVGRDRIKPGSVLGCVNYGYVVIGINGHKYRAHRLAWLYVYGKWPSKLLDHENGIRSDNRLCNLREADHSQNAFNRRLRSDNTSGQKGVVWNKRNSRWTAEITVRGERFFLGSFSDKKYAVRAYQAAEASHFGEFISP